MTPSYLEEATWTTPGSGDTNNEMVELWSSILSNLRRLELQLFEPRETFLVG